jgi:hypothetical protein
MDGCIIRMGSQILSARTISQKYFSEIFRSMPLISLDAGRALTNDPGVLSPLAIILINHNHGDLIKRTINSLGQLPDECPFHLFVVNNLPDPGLTEWLREGFPSVTRIENSVSRGFSANVNGVIRDHAWFPLYLLLNPDVVCLPGVLDRLISTMTQDDTIGIAGPRLLNMDGTVQPSARRFPNLPALVVRALHLDGLFRRSRFLRDYLQSETHITEVTPVEWIVGAVMMLRKAALDQVGLMDERFVMYFEDVDLCYRMWEAGWQVCLVPEAKAYHQALAESRKRYFSRARFRHIASALKYFLKHRSRPKPGSEEAEG